jgi:hypothetical protein
LVDEVVVGEDIMTGGLGGATTMEVIRIDVDIAKMNNASLWRWLLVDDKNPLRRTLIMWAIHVTPLKSNINTTTKGVAIELGIYISFMTPTCMRWEVWARIAKTVWSWKPLTTGMTGYHENR